jgi:hypothetical protein
VLLETAVKFTKEAAKEPESEAKRKVLAKMKFLTLIETKNDNCTL